MRKYRRINRSKDSSHQSYQLSLIAFGLFSLLTGFSFFTFTSCQNSRFFSSLSGLFRNITILFVVISLVLFVISVITFFHRELVTTLEIPSMSSKAKRLSRKIKSLFNDKQISDVLKLSNLTRFGDEFPFVYVWISDDFNFGYIAIENIATYDRMDRDKYEQKVSGILGGKYKRFAVISSELTSNDSYMLFHFEDTLTSYKLIINEKEDTLSSYVSKDPHAILLSKDLIWHAEMTPHLSVIARTRAGKSVLCGRYMAELMRLQGWTVDYNSAKFDRYVKEFNGKSEPLEVVERAEYWCEVMLERLNEINEAGQEKYLDLPDLVDIALFFDEIGNLNAALELDKSLKKRWEVAINKLTATGGAAGIHVIAISQFATKEAFLPSLARVNCSDAVIMLAGAADSADERRFLMSGFADLPKRNYKVGQGVARIITSGKKWETPHFFEAPRFI
ncbi:cell division protein FtsK [Liquorilactobacillus nagelii]|jgi:hypothetical protein|uniref:Cell division protein FtsK n=3 Tax=Lactobacillaceae TaxID=33958 RepID=A0A3Q8CLF8_9LACO|nr:cell division protein FtsK [Liquorilactobacillus nagelii]AUJ31346.1 cell division protein FtsK [Liquorilactobacillus nagelii]